MNQTRARFYFDSLASAAEALVTVLLDARETEHTYRFGSLNPRQILVSGLLLEGQIDEVSAKLEDLIGVVRYEE